MSSRRTKVIVKFTARESEAALKFAHDAKLPLEVLVKNSLWFAMSKAYVQEPVKSGQAEVVPNRELTAEEYIELGRQELSNNGTTTESSGTSSEVSSNEDTASNVLAGPEASADTSGSAE